jgi:hypothetical protein
VNSLSSSFHNASNYLLMSALILLRIGIAKTQHKLWQRCVVLLPSFLGLSFFTRPRIWQTVCLYLCLILHVMAPVHKFSLVYITGLPASLPARLPKHADEDGYSVEIVPLRSAADGIPLRSPRATESFRATWYTCLKFATALRSWGFRTTWEGKQWMSLHSLIGHSPIGWL